MLTVSSHIPNFYYAFGSGAKTVTTPAFAQSVANCPVGDFGLQIYNNDLRVWQNFASGTHGFFISAFAAATGVVTITNTGLNASSNSIKPVAIYLLKISRTSTDSNSSV